MDKLIEKYVKNASSYGLFGESGALEYLLRQYTDELIDSLRNTKIDKQVYNQALQDAEMVAPSATHEILLTGDEELDKNVDRYVQGWVDMRRKWAGNINCLRK